MTNIELLEVLSTMVLCFVDRICYTKNMAYYKHFMQTLKQKNIMIGSCKPVQTVANDSIVAYMTQKGDSYTLSHRLISGKQEVYLIVEQDSICALHSIDVLQCNIEEKAIVHFTILVLQGAQFSMNLAYLYALDVDCTIHVYLEGDRSKADIQGLYALSKEQRISINTYQYHSGVDSRSNLVVKGMLTDFAQAMYSGLIKIDEFAKRVDASQENKNIVLSSRAKVISIPSIEVLEYDVQCSHGSAIGKFDEDDIWYLQSKGFLLDKAIELLIRSFFGEVVENLENKDEIMDSICQKMKQI